jgi:hypothetical protein
MTAEEELNQIMNKEIALALLEQECPDCSPKMAEEISESLKDSNPWDAVAMYTIRKKFASCAA